uniref:MIF4G domain-containing protein n=1 Tax=Anopheles christyi TaxID=43041 RepID=A0A182K2D0_9DIPT
MERKGSNNERVGDNHQPSLLAGGDQQQAAIFDEMRQEIGKIDVYAETIELTYHLRKFAELFRRRITTEQQLNDLFLHLNEEALSENGFAIQFALVFSSRQLGDVSIDGTNIRNAMIGTLQRNFLAIEQLKQQGGERFYNSITLLGEYYNRKMVALGSRIKILGQSLLLLLTSELEQEINKICQQSSTHRLDPGFAKVLLQQITLNGSVWKEDHRKEANDLLYTMRKALIVIPNLCAPAKAFLLMALDMYNGNLVNELLDKLYGKYLTEPKGKSKEENTSTVVTGDVSNDPSEPSTTHNQTAAGEKSTEKQGKKESEKDAPVQKPKGTKSSTTARLSGGSKAANQNLTTNDKENKRRTTQTSKPAAPAQKTSPKASTGRSIRVHEDGNIVATITRDTPATPTKKQPPAVAQPTPPPPRSPTKKGLSPRMEKLAALPKITITGATPSPKRTQDKPSALSPRAVLGPSIAKQKPHQPPKSPSHSREGQYGARNGSDVSRVRHDRNVRGGKGTKDVSSPVHNIHPNEPLPHIEPANEVPSSATQTPIVEFESPKPYLWSEQPEDDHSYDWSYMPPSETDKTADCTAAVTGDDTRKKKEVDSARARVSKSKSKVQPSYFREENVENLTWDVLIPLDDESPQKVNPHTKSFLSFLASE